MVIVHKRSQGQHWEVLKVKLQQRSKSKIWMVVGNDLTHNR